MLTLFRRLLPCAALLTVTLSAQDWEEKFPLDGEPLDRGQGEVVLSYADVLEPAQTAVVSVTSSSVIEVMRRRQLDPREEFLRRFFGMPAPRQPNGQQEEAPEERRIPNGLGSGVIISSDGYILTNNHVVVDDSGEAADEITIMLPRDRKEHVAELIGRDPRTDVALLKIDAEGLPYLPMASSENLRVGDVVFAIGNPLGVGVTSTMGIVSATERSNLRILGAEGYEFFIQTDAAINRGNSGGALIDAMGRLVGINTAIASPTGGNIGIGFAIPISLARSIVLELLATGEVQRGFLGVSIQDLDAELAEAFGLDRPRGALIEAVQEGFPADKAGLKRGDVILEVDGKDVDTVAELRLRIASLRPGTETELTVFRDGEETMITVRLGSREDPDGFIDPVTGQASPLDGVDLRSVSEDLAERFDLEAGEGVLVADVDARSPYAPQLQPGMVILEVNDQAVNNPTELAEALRMGRANRLYVRFRGQEGYLALRVREE